MLRNCPGGAFVIFGATLVGAPPQWEMTQCAGAAGLRATALARAPRSGITLRVALGGDGKRVGSAGTSRERLSGEFPLRLPAHAFVCEPRRSVPRGDCAPRAAAVRPAEPGATAGKVARGPAPGERVGRRRGTCPAASSPCARPAPGRTAPGGSAAEGEKKMRQGEGFLKNNQQNTGSGRFRFHFCFPLPQPCPHLACPASVPGPRLGSRRLRLSLCREAERRVDPHPSPGERGQVCR